MNIDRLTSNSTAQTALEYLHQAGVTVQELHATATQPAGRASVARGQHAHPPRITALPRSRLNRPAVSTAGAVTSGVPQGPQGQGSGPYITPASAATAPPRPAPTLAQEVATIQAAMVNMQGYDPRGSTKARYRAIRQHDQLHGTNWTIEAMRSAVSSEPCRSFADVDRQFEPDNAEAAEVRQAAQASEAYANCTNPSQRYKTLLELKESLGKNWSRLSMCKVADVGQANCLKIENANLAPKGLAKLIRDEVFGTRKAATKADAYRAILDYRDTHAKAWNVSDMRSAAQIDPDQASDVEFHRAPDWAEVDTLRTAVQNEAAFTAASSAKTRYEALLAIKTRTGADWAERDMIKLSGIVLSNAARVHRALQLPPPSRPTVPGAAAPGRT